MTQVKTLNIVADENIPALAKLLPAHCAIQYVPGREITTSDIASADVLLVRSITKVNAALLDDTAVKFVGSCTIGTDHIDLAYLQQQQIAFANAPGCNADAVVDYVLAAMFSYQADMQYWQGKTAGIVGLGQVGSRLQKRLSGMGLKVIAYDPFVAAATASYEEVLGADLVSFHVPITTQGEHASYHMLAANELKRLKPNALLINSCRGKVFDNQALWDFIEAQPDPNKRIYAVLDVYEDEPCPDEKFLQALDVATAHIAGYSEQGKIRGSAQVVEAMLAHFDMPFEANDCLASTQRPLQLEAGTSAEQLLLCGYDIKADSQRFISHFMAADKSREARAHCFDQFRKNYPVRTEFSFFKLCNTGPQRDVALRLLGFKP